MSAVPIKICRLQSRICVGGPARQTILLSARLDPKRYKTVLVGGAVEPGERDVLHEASQLGVRTIRIPEMGRPVNPLKDYRSYRRLCAIFRRERPDIVHTHTAKAGAIGRLAARATGVPIIIHTFHGHVLRGYFNSAVSRVFQEVERWLARRTDRIIAISESQFRELSDEFRIAPPDKIRVIPLGLDLNRFLCGEKLRGLLRRELSLTIDTSLIGWIGRLTEVKNPLLFLQVCALLVAAPATPAPHFLIVGEGHLRPILEREAGLLGIGSRVHFLGYRSDLDRIYADLDLFVMTSRNEGTPVAMIEAMAAGLPVVATAVGGVMDVTRGYAAATLLLKGDREGMAVAVASALRLNGKRSDGRPTVRRFGADRLVRDIESLYEEVLTERGISESRARAA